LESLLIENSIYSQSDWLAFLNQAAEKLPYKFGGPLKLALNIPEFINSSGSIGGLELLLQKNGLKVFPSILPSRKDLRFIRQLIEMAVQKGCAVLDEKGTEVKPTMFSNEKLNKHFESYIAKASSTDSIVVQAFNRKIDISAYLCEGLSTADLERKLIDFLDKVFRAPQPEIFPIDDVDSIIWDGGCIWLPSSVKQILFSQKYFKGKLCGEIALEKFIEAVPDRIQNMGDGYLLSEGKALSASDIQAIHVRMATHFEEKKEKKVYEKLEIEVGKLQEISYVMSKCIFSSDSLTKVTEKYKEQGISQAQLEVAALAVSAMLEIAAISGGDSLDAMTKKLITKNKLTKNAAFAIVNGFVQAAGEVKSGSQKKVNWGRLLLIGAVVALIVWLISR
jgi:hypothetical protein